jgi:DNA processing protein
MKYTENALNILTVRSFPKKGPAWIHNNLIGNESVDVLCEKMKCQLSDFCEKRDEIKNSLFRLGESADGVVAIGDANFPETRGIVNKSDRPVALFYKGNLSLLQKTSLNIAIIGVLTPDKKVEISEKIVADYIVKKGATILSGLALGCDTIAHKVALNNHGKTIAILPSPLNNIHPKENSELAFDIVQQGGLLISEYYESPKGRNDLVSRFVVRDRLQALYSDAVLLVASYAVNDSGKDCGSRHAMGKAKSYGIKRAVIYNDNKHRDNSMYDLNRQILKEDSSVVRIDSDNMIKSIDRLLKRHIENSIF